MGWTCQIAGKTLKSISLKVMDPSKIYEKMYGIYFCRNLNFLFRSSQTLHHLITNSTYIGKIFYYTKSPKWFSLLVKPQKSKVACASSGCYLIFTYTDFSELWIQGGGGRNMRVRIIYCARKFLNFGIQNLEIINISIISKGLCKFQ